MAKELVDGGMTVRELITKLLGYRMDATVQFGGNGPDGQRRELDPGANSIFGRANEERPSLSAREIEVLQLSADGLSDKEVAERLFISVRTVQFHLDSVRSKIGVDTTSKAYVAAIINGDVLCPCRYAHKVA